MRKRIQRSGTLSYLLFKQASSKFPQCPLLKMNSVKLLTYKVQQMINPELHLFVDRSAHMYEHYEEA